MKLPIILPALLALTGCVAPTVVSDFNGDSVTVESGTPVPENDAVREASRTCGSRNMVAEYTSSRLARSTMPAAWAHLFICQPPIKR